MIVLLYVALVPNSTDNRSDTLRVSPVEVTSDYVIMHAGWICNIEKELQWITLA